jgi:hypothetical protein
MSSHFKHFLTAILVGAGCAGLSGCILSGFSGGTAGGVTTATATVILSKLSDCTTDVVANTVTCTPKVSVVLPNGTTQSFSFSFTLNGLTTPFPIFDPLILELPDTMSGFAGSIAIGPAGVTPGTPLDITAGLTSIAIDAHTTLTAEPGMQLVIIDFQAPANAPFGQYTVNIQFTGTATSFKALLASKVTIPGPVSAAKAAGQTYFVPFFPCVTSFAAVPSISLPLGNLLQLVPTLTTAQGCNGKVFDFTGGAAATVDVIEFYNAGLDHYFITYGAQEISDLDTGVHKGWARTTKSFKAYTTPQTGTSPVCRFYIPPAQGDSHFFGRGTQECTDTAAKFPTFIEEDPAFMQMFLPVAGVCPANTTEVYRVFSNRADANHRYMTDKAVRDAMVAKGWLAEGDGPNLVVMCAP